MDVCVFDVDANNSFNASDLSSSDMCMITGPESGFSKSEINLLNINKYLRWGLIKDPSETLKI